jgi:hypothetical protein
MQRRRVLVGLGAGLSTFFVVAVLVIEALDFEFSAIIGLPVGGLVGILGFVLVQRGYDSLSPPVRATLDGVAGAGLGILGLLWLRYLHLASFDLTALLGGALAFGVLIGAASWLDHRREVEDTTFD